MRANVRAEVDHEPVAQGHDHAVAADPDLHLVILLPRMVGRHQMLMTVLDPLHRTAQAHRRPRHHEVLGIELAAYAEAAAHLELDEVDQVLGMAEQVGENPAVEVRHLRHAPEREHARPGVVAGGEAARLHRHAGVTLDGEPLSDAPLGGRERARRVTGARHQTFDDVATGRRMKNRHARIARTARVGDDRQRLPVDLDQLERVLCEIAARGDNEDDRLADVTDDPGGERRLQARGRADPGALSKPHRNARDRPEIFRGDHREDAGECARRVRAHARDPRMRMRRAQDRRVQQARHAHVGGVLAAPRQEAEILLAPHRGADHAILRRVLETRRWGHERR